MAAKNKSNEIRITRVYDAPVKLVWDAWTDPKKVAMWWGPRGFTLTTHSKDLRPGGHWDYTMHGPDGTDYENKTIYHEVEEGKRLVYDHGGNDDRPPLFRVTATFSEIKGPKTKLEMSFALATVEAAEDMRKFIKKAGGDATWDRLAEHLDRDSQGQEPFFINRAFDAPIELMFDLWSKPEHFCKWVAPTGFSMEFIRADIKVGHSTFSRLSDGQSTTMYARAKYIEIIRPHRIVYTQQFIDEKENISRHPHAPTWPETMLTTVTFAEEAPDRTRVTVKWEIHGEATAAEIETFHKSKPGMTIGWTGSFDKLEALIEKL